MVRPARFQMVREEGSHIMVLVRPTKATHALLTTADGKKALVEVANLDCLSGVEGELQWMRLAPKSREILGSVKFDGEIEEITSDYQQQRKRK